MCVVGSTNLLSSRLSYTMHPPHYLTHDSRSGWGHVNDVEIGAEVRTADISMLHPLCRSYPPRACCVMRLQPPRKRPFRLHPLRFIIRPTGCASLRQLPSAVSVNIQLIHPCLFRRTHLVVRTSASACSACVRPRSRPASCIPPVASKQKSKPRIAMIRIPVFAGVTHLTLTCPTLHSPTPQPHGICGGQPSTTDSLER